MKKERCKGIMILSLNEIRSAEPFESLFPVDNKVLSAIIDDMRQNGFDPAQPLILGHWPGGKQTLIDGHTRKLGAAACGLSQAPVVVKEFASEDSAVEYAIHCQRDRRNIMDSDIARFTVELDMRKKTGPTKKGLASSDANSGKSSAHTAAVIGTSERKVEKVRTVLKHAAPEVKAAVLAGKKSINAAYKETQTARKANPPATSAPAAANAPAKPSPKPLTMKQKMRLDEINPNAITHEGFRRAYEELADAMVLIRRDHFRTMSLAAIEYNLQNLTDIAQGWKEQEGDRQSQSSN